MNATHTEGISPIEDIIAEIRQGHMVVLVDDEDRENEGDLVFAADFVTPEKINFMVRHARGLVCLTLTELAARALELPPMARVNGTAHGTNFTVSIEAASGVTTGISAADRAHTIRVATRPCARASDIVQPGHVFPIVAQPGGVLMRAGHTEAGCDLTQLAGLNAAAVICEIMNDDGSMARLPDLIPFARAHGLKIGTIADLIQYRAATESLITRLGACPVRLPAGTFQLVAYRDTPSHGVHLALVHGEPQADQETWVRVHEPVSVLDMLVGDVSSHSWPWMQALHKIAAAPAGVMVLLNCAQSSEHLASHFQTLLHLNPLGAEVESSEGRPSETQSSASVDLRTYGIGAQILRDLGVGQMKLLARPRKMPSMAGFGLTTTGYMET